MVTHAKMLEIKNWLNTPDGRVFAESLSAKLKEVGFRVQLKQLSQICPDVLRPFNQFLQGKKTPGALKFCIQQIANLKVYGLCLNDSVIGEESVQYGRPIIPTGRSWEDFFVANKNPIFVGNLTYSAMSDFPGYASVTLKDCRNADGPMNDKTFPCPIDSLFKADNNTPFLGFPNPKIADRPFLFTGLKSPVEVVDWGELSDEAFTTVSNGHIRFSAKCDCLFDWLIVVSGNRAYSGFRRGRDREIIVEEVRDLGDVVSYIEEHRATCWTYCMDCGVDGLYRLMAPKQEYDVTTETLVRLEETILDKQHTKPITNAPIKPSVGNMAYDWVNHHDDELAFLRRLSEYLDAAGFYFEPRDIVRFHASVKLGALTLLSGEPGCGKSSLARLYANAIAGRAQEKDDENSNFKRVYVNRTWLSSYDMLGYPERGLNGVKPAENGLLEFLRKTGDEGKKDVLHEVCLEEMNLAQIEYYFSDFLQILSSGEMHDKDVIPGMGKDGTPLKIGGNVFFVGTCNRDHTVSSFSDRFLDRCSYVELSARSEKCGFPEVVPEIMNDEPLRRPLRKADGSEFTLTQSVFKSWLADGKDCLTALCASPLNDFLKVVQPLFKDAGLPLAPRTLVKMARYICCRPCVDGSLASTAWLAIDEAFAQMVLPRATPTKKMMGMAMDIAKEFKTIFRQQGIKESESLSAARLEGIGGEFRDRMNMDISL